MEAFSEEVLEAEKERKRTNFIQESISFMQAIIAEYGEEKGEQMWDTIITTLDPSVKRQMLMMMLTGNLCNKIVIRGFVGEPKKVAAIKAVREVTGLLLKEAKNIIDEVYGYTQNKSFSPNQIHKGESAVEIEVDAESRREAIKILEAAGCWI